MKRAVILLILTAFIAAILAACGGEPPPPPPPPPPPVDTTPVDTTPPPPPPPPPAPPELKETQFQTVYFDFDKYNLRPDARAALDSNYALLVEFSDVIIKIEGHCDERGTVEYNLLLGEQRAQAAMDYLVGKGINMARMSVISYGKERPVAMGHNEEAWAKNRRCEFRIISQ